MLKCNYAHNNGRRIEVILTDAQANRMFARGGPALMRDGSITWRNENGYFYFEPAVFPVPALPWYENIGGRP